MFIELLVFGSALTLWRGFQETAAHPIVPTNPPEPEPSLFSKATLLVEDLKTAIFGDDRQQMQLNLDPERKAEIEARKQQENHKIILSAGANYSVSRCNGIGYFGDGVTVFLSRWQWGGHLFGSSRFEYGVSRF